MFLAISALSFSSCEKDVNPENEQNITTQEASDQVSNKSLETGISVEYSYNEVINTLKGENFKSQLNWQQLDGGNLNEIGNITLNYSDLGEIKIAELTSESVVLTTEQGDFSFSIYNQNENELFMTINGASNRTTDFKVTDPSSSIQSLYGNYEVGDIIVVDDMDETAIRPLVWAAATLIAASVDYYCDSTIASDVAACTASAMCSVVNTCSAECVTCGD